MHMNEENRHNIMRKIIRKKNVGTTTKTENEVGIDDAWKREPYTK